MKCGSISGFTLSLRDVEALLAERGIDVSYETIR
jgi:transposase-like protein